MTFLRVAALSFGFISVMHAYTSRFRGADKSISTERLEIGVQPIRFLSSFGLMWPGSLDSRDTRTVPATSNWLYSRSPPEKFLHEIPPPVDPGEATICVTL